MPSDNPANLSEKHTGNFIHAIVSADVAANKNNGRVITRFPPEPNGYLHIGHAKSICLNFGIASEFHGHCNLRFDDTNPEKENLEYIESIKRDVQWLGFEWAELRYASAYFDALYEHAVKLIEMGKAYVDSQNSDEIRLSRGTLTSPGRNSPYRVRSPTENLDLFERMRAGEFADGSHVLRAKIDMASPNINLRDPVIYRIRHARHHQTEDRWCLYPMYDYAHCLSDAFEGITHSLCTLEFEDHRPLYDWILDTLKTPCHPQQIEFARLSLEYTVLSKRKLQQLVEEGHVDSWDDPRMPTLSGLRRRGYTPAALREFCSRIGITKKDSLIEISALETALREDLDAKAPRAMAVLNPLRVVIHSYPEDKTEILSAPNHPQRPELGQRHLPFSRVLYIEQDDFLEEPPKKFFRLSPGAEVRLRHAYIIKCEHVIKDADGKIVELHCTHDPETLGRNPTDRKVKGVIHWVSAAHAFDAEVRLYDHLFTQPNPAAADNFLQTLNPNSLQILKTCKLESSLADARPGFAYQFERQGYFCLDSNIHDTPVYNLTVTLRDSWAKMQNASQK